MSSEPPGGRLLRSELGCWQSVGRAHPSNQPEGSEAKLNISFWQEDLCCQQLHLDSSSTLQPPDLSCARWLTVPLAAGKRLRDLNQSLYAQDSINQLRFGPAAREVPFFQDVRELCNGAGLQALAR